MTNSHIRLTAALGLALLLPACALQTEPEPEPGTYVGTIEVVDHPRFTSSRPNNVHVRAEEDACGVIFEISGTRIELSDGPGEFRPVTKDTLRAGDRVEVFAPGTWLRSCPQLATAQRIRILR